MDIGDREFERGVPHRHDLSSILGIMVFVVRILYRLMWPCLYEVSSGRHMQEAFFAKGIFIPGAIFCRTSEMSSLRADKGRPSWEKASSTGDHALDRALARALNGGSVYCWYSGQFAAARLNAWESRVLTILDLRSYLCSFVITVAY